MAEKRSITAREAKDNLEAFGYDGPARWSSIDAFATWCFFKFYRTERVIESQS